MNYDTNEKRLEAVNDSLRRVDAALVLKDEPLTEKELILLAAHYAHGVILRARIQAMISTGAK